MYSGAKQSIGSEVKENKKMLIVEDDLNLNSTPPHPALT